jgi:hypothetical protein
VELQSQQQLEAVALRESMMRIQQTKVFGDQEAMVTTRLSPLQGIHLLLQAAVVAEVKELSMPDTTVPLVVQAVVEVFLDLVLEAVIQMLRTQDGQLQPILALVHPEWAVAVAVVPALHSVAHLQTVQTESQYLVMQSVVVVVVGPGVHQLSMEMRSVVDFLVPAAPMSVPADHVMEARIPAAVVVAAEMVAVALRSLNTSQHAIKEVSSQQETP